MHIGQMAGLKTVSTFDRLGQYASSPGNRVYCYGKLAISSLVVAKTIASTHSAYAHRPGQVGLGGLIKFQDGIPLNGGGMKRLVIYQDGLPIPIVTGPDVEQLH